MISVRINTLYAHESDIRELITSLGGSVVAVPWNGDAFIVNGIDTRALTETEAYMQGHFYIQSLPSMIPALALQLEQNDSVLDLCAAPGSKTTQLAALLENTGTIVANDVSRDRLFKLKANGERMGVTNVTYSMMPGAGMWRRYPEHFDRVLCDVPCSMGQRYAPKNLKMLVSRQKKLIRSAFSCLKTGGLMVYSTCSPRVEENDEVIAYLLKHESTATVVPISIKNLPNEWLTESGMVRMFANDQHEDFFVALIQKTEA